MVSAPAATKNSTKTMSTTRTDRPVRACTCGNVVTSGVTSSALVIVPIRPSKQARIASANQVRMLSRSQPMIVSAPDDALDDLQQDRREHGQAVADERVLQRSLSFVDLGRVTASGGPVDPG